VRLRCSFSGARERCDEPKNVQPGHWSEQPPRFSARRWSPIRKRLVRSTVTVGGCRSVLSFDNGNDTDQIECPAAGIAKRLRSRIGYVGYRTTEWDGLTMKERITRSTVTRWGLACYFAPWSVSSATELANTMEGNRIACRAPDCASGLRDVRALRAGPGHILSNHSVHRTAAGHSHSGVGFAADVLSSSCGGR